MSAELQFALFLAIGGLAVVSAVGMLLFNNAVYSALCLIVTMGCIAFMFLWLEAPFLAMVQIAVYAGAIMVLFLFVIMLLGAEKAELIDPKERGKMRWQPFLALLLAGAFLLLSGIVIISGQIDLQTPPPQNAMLRVAHFAPVNIALNVSAAEIQNPGTDQQTLGAATLLREGIEFRDVSDFTSLPSGQYRVSFLVGDQSVTELDVDLTPGSAQTVMLYGTGRSAIAVVQDLSPVPEGQARVTFVNLFNTPLSLAQIVSEQFDSRTVETYFADVAPGTTAAPRIFDEGSYQWTVIEPGAEALIQDAQWDNNPRGRLGIVYRMNPLDLPRNTSQLLVLLPDLLPELVSGQDNAVRPLTISLVSASAPSFGSPQAIGYTLFTTYLLPFQMIAMLLLVAMVGAVLLTHKEPIVARRRDVRRKVSRPLTSVIASQTGTDILKPAGDQLPETAQPSGD